MSNRKLLFKAGVWVFFLFVRNIYKLYIYLKRGHVVKKSGVVFSSEMNARHGQSFAYLPARNYYFAKCMKYGGASMFSFSLALFVFSYGPFVSGDLMEADGASVVVDAVDAKDKPLRQAQDEPSLYGVNSDFSVVIPSLEVASNVVADVDAGNPDEYLPAMLEGVAHAYGTSYPGESGTTYLFAHSTNSPVNIARFNAVFFELQKVGVGEHIIVFYKNTKHEYKVVEKKIVEVSDTSELTEWGFGERLILQTSHPPGTVWKRLIVIAEPV